MQLELPERIAGAFSHEELQFALALGLYASDRATLGQAADLAGMSQGQFQLELGRRRIPAHYGLAELEQDIESVETLTAK
jgi:predicted HTH domain antitoxin